MMSNWLEERIDGDHGFLWMMGATFVFAFGLFFVIVAAAMWIDRSGCGQIEATQQVDTEWHWNTGCIYVDPDYIVGN